MSLAAQTENGNLITLKGRVVEAYTDNPIAGIPVQVSAYDYPFVFDITIYTDQDGYWTIQAPSGHDYDYIVDAASYGYSVEGIYNDNVTKLFPLELLAIVKGKVVDATNRKPIPNAKVSIIYHYSFISLFDPHEDDEGSYEIEETVTDEYGNYSCVFMLKMKDRFEFGGQDSWSYSVRCGDYEEYLTGGYDYGEGKLIVENGELMVVYERNIETTMVVVGEDAGLVDGIYVISKRSYDERHYGISGAEVVPTSKGLHIVKGKKVMVK